MNEVPTMIKAVIFDYGGVIGTNVMPAIYSETAKISGMSYEKVRVYFREFSDDVLKGTLPLSEFWVEYARLLNVNPKLLEQTWVATYREHSKKNEEVVNIIKSLKKERYKLGLLSNAMKIFSDHRKKWGRELFDVIIISHEVGIRKPEKEIYELAVEKLQLKAEECVFIDDMLKNVKAAQTVGMKAILFKDAEQLKKDLKKYGVEF